MHLPSHWYHSSGILSLIFGHTGAIHQVLFKLHLKLKRLWIEKKRTEKLKDLRCKLCAGGMRNEITIVTCTQ